ncbi:MAG: L-fucose/L-arabinose isomerase family protein [Nitrososphaerales archaeon]
MKHTLHVGFIPVARPTFDVPLATDMASRMRASLEEAGCVLRGPADLVMDLEALRAAADQLLSEPVDLLLAFQASFADSTTAVDLARMVPDAPLLLWAAPEERTGGRLRLNSFSGINLAGHALRRAGLKYEYVFAQPEDSQAMQKLLTLARAGRVRRNLKNARVGRFGLNPDGFEPCTYDGEALAARLGVQVVQRGLADVFDGAAAAAVSAVEPVLANLQERVDGLGELEQDPLRKTLGAYVTLGRLADENLFSGLAIRCWPEFFTELGCAVCGAMSLLTDEMTPCACEADVNGAITGLMLQGLSGEPAMGIDMVGWDLDRDEAVLWRCGVAPLSMADPDVRPRATVHSSHMKPLLMEFPLKPGRVTLARLSQATGEYRLVVGIGEMQHAPRSYAGTSSVLRFDRPAQEVLNMIMAEGLDHHISLTYGDHLDALLALARLLDLPVLRLS